MTKLTILFIAFIVTAVLGAWFTQYVFSLHNYTITYWTALMTNLWIGTFIVASRSK